MQMKQGNLAKLVITSFLIVSFLIIAFCGCQPQPSGEIEVRVIVTQDFGSEVMLEKFVTLSEGSTAMDALQEAATVETQYGGGFVKAINGVASEAHKDWVFYINGISANKGALDYELHDGDIEHWDFRDWSFHQFVPAIIGDFPQPFSGGYGGEVLPTIVVYDEGFEDTAQNLTNKLEELGVKNSRVQAAAALSTEDKQHCNLILLGTEDFDVTTIDPASVRLVGVAPIRWAMEDVATPYEEDLEDCDDCHELMGDGYADLTLKFDAQEVVVTALGEVEDGDCLRLELTGNLKEEFGGTSIAGEDVVLILKKK